MDISRFVNSRDIREHLQTINYEFNAMEAAWLVYQCVNTTIEERHTAWTWIIENMADMEVIERPNCIYRKSLHDTLRRYMAMQNEFLDEFLSTEDVIYTCQYCCRRTPERCEEVFFSLDDCFRETKEYADHLVTEGESRDVGTVISRHFRDKNYRIEAYYDYGCRPCSITLVGDCPNEEYVDLEAFFFQGMWFDFPVPFKKGDIVRMYYYDPEDAWEYDFCKGLIVLEGILPWYLEAKGPASIESYIEGRNGDESDMTVYGFFMSEDGCFYRECTYNYMNLEYYRGPLTGINRLYKTISSFLRGDIDEELLLYAYRIIVLESMREKSESNLYIEDVLKLAGLN